MPNPHVAKAPGYPRCPKCRTILDNGRCTECPAATKPPVLTYAMNVADCRTCDCGVREDALGKSQFRRHMKSCRVRSNEMQKKGTSVAAVAVCNSCGVPLVDGACDNCKAMDAWWTETLGDDPVDQSTSSKEPPLHLGSTGSQMASCENTPRNLGSTQRAEMVRGLKQACWNEETARKRPLDGREDAISVPPPAAPLVASSSVTPLDRPEDAMSVPPPGAPAPDMLPPAAVVDLLIAHHRPMRQTWSPLHQHPLQHLPAAPSAPLVLAA